MSQTEAEILEEFSRLCTSAAERRQVSIDNPPSIAIRTVNYGGFEVIESPIIVADGRPLELILGEPVLYLGAELHEDGIHIAHASFDKENKERVIYLLQSAHHLSVERLAHYPHPLLAHPSMHGDMWAGWTASGGTFEQDLEGKVPYTKATIEQAMRYLPDLMRYKYGRDTNIAVLACGEGPELLALANLLEQRPDVKLLGIDQNAQMLKRVRGVLPSRVDLKRLDLKDLSKKVKPNSIDMVIAIGLFDMQTLEWQDGVNILGEVRRVLKEDGYGVFASYGLKLFSRTHYQQLGFEVKKCSNPSTFFSRTCPEPYVVQKKKGKPVQSRLVNPIYAESNQWKQYPQLLSILRPQIIE